MLVSLSFLFGILSVGHNQILDILLKFYIVSVAIWLSFFKKIQIPSHFIFIYLNYFGLLV